MVNGAPPLVYVVETPLMAEFCREVLKHSSRPVAVETFSDPEEAVNAFCSAPVRPRVVCTSLVSMQGLRLAANIKQIDPTVRVLLMSGLGKENMNDCVGTSPVEPDDVLAKPFSPQDLASKVLSLIE